MPHTRPHASMCFAVLGVCLCLRRYGRAAAGGRRRVVDRPKPARRALRPQARRGELRAEQVEELAQQPTRVLSRLPVVPGSGLRGSGG